MIVSWRAVRRYEKAGRLLIGTVFFCLNDKALKHEMYLIFCTFNLIKQKCKTAGVCNFLIKLHEILKAHKTIFHIREV